MSRKNNTKSTSLEDLQRTAVEALRSSLTASDTERTECLRETARAFIAAREHFYTRDGSPDWPGRTYAYRTWVREVMSLANVPSEDLASTQAAVRYHTGNFLRERLGDDELEALGLRTSSPRERSVEKRERTSETLALFSGGKEIASLEEIRAAVAAMESALARVNMSHLAPTARAKANAAIESLAEKARELTRK